MIAAFSFLTILGRGRVPDARALVWFPAVGLVVGGTVALAHEGAHRWWMPALAAALVVAVDLVVTGALHLDGTADTADGLLPHMERSRRLEVMADPTIGAFALVMVIVVLLTRWAAFTDPTLEVLAVVSLWVASRTVVAVVPAVVAYARPGGLAQVLVEGASRWPVVFLVPALALATYTDGTRGAGAVLACVTAAVLVIAWSVRRIGGYTGDVLGAAIVVPETIGLVVLAVRP